MHTNIGGEKSSKCQCLASCCIMFAYPARNCGWGIASQWGRGRGKKTDPTLQKSGAYGEKTAVSYVTSKVFSFCYIATGKFSSVFNDRYIYTSNSVWKLPLKCVYSIYESYCYYCRCCNGDSVLVLPSRGSYWHTPHWLPESMRS